MIRTFIASLLFIGFVTAEEKVKLPSKDKFHLYLLVGQSNMAGRGKVEDEDKKPHPRVMTLNKAGEWVPAVDPLHWDKSAAGVGLGKTFGTLVAEKNKDITVGLIPCAHGGSPIDAWVPGHYYEPTKGKPWDDMIARTKKAFEAGELKGILWHQGESDANAKLAGSYEKKLHDLIAKFRKDLNAESVPFILGGIGQFKDKQWNEYQKQIDGIHRDVEKKVKNTAYVSSEGLTHKGDMVHFDSASYRTFGKRYYEALEKLIKK